MSRFAKQGIRQSGTHSNGAKSRNGLRDNIKSYCLTANMFSNKDMNVEIHCHLLKAFLQAENPQTLACFFKVFAHFMETRLLRDCLPLGL